MASPGGVDKFLIAPFRSGLVKNMEPWQTPDDSFEELRNAYVYRGKIRKKFGSAYSGVAATALGETLQSRLRVPLTGGAGVGATDGAGDATGTIPGANYGAGFKTGQMFSIGTELFTIYQAGSPANMLKTGATVTATFDSVAGTYNFAGATAGTQIYYYPSDPVMGFALTVSGDVNNHTAFAYDTQFMYKFSGTSWERIGAQVYTGSNTDYFWTTSWDGITPETTALFSTNFYTADSMYYSVNSGVTWTAFRPKVLVGVGATNNIVKTAKIILPFKNRLVLLNTYEYTDVSGGAAYTNKAFTNRCRYSWNGSPIDAAGYGWLEPDQANAGGAGYIDAPTEEAIVSAAFIKDRLIVYFENSTFELAYTGNEILPFVWQKLNSEFGSQATFSSVEFDSQVLNIGSSGIHSCSGVGVQRIDSKIPNEISRSLHLTAGVKRIAGIRDFMNELVYWTIPRPEANDTNNFPDRVLVYNYKNDTWAINDDCVTAWGYFEKVTGETWEADFQEWQNDNSTWNDGVEISNFRQVIAGNQHGFVFMVDSTLAKNASVLQVTNVTIATSQLTILNHNLTTGDYIKLEDLNGITIDAGADDGIRRVSVIDNDTVSLDGTVLTGVYTGGGRAARVSNIRIMSKEWTLYITAGQGTSINKVSFYVLKTDNGEIGIDYFPSSSDLNINLDASVNDVSMSDGSLVLDTKPYDLVPLEATQKRLWHPIYMFLEGSTVQILLSFTDAQMKDSTISEVPFEVHAIMLETKRSNLWG